jgi:peptidoglycan-associated lipoprotein
MGGDLDEGTGQQFTDLFLVTQDKKGKWSTPVILPEPISSKFNEGAASMNDKGSGLFFTRCGVEKKKKMGCQIYFAQKKGPNWDFPELITLNNDTSTSALTFGHPSISSNELTLYFASDMPGGQGGKDVWCVKRTKKNKPWGKPENLGPVINTAGDEMFPYIHDNGMLFFSSNYHLGMGGMDIFKSEPKADGSFGAPENMKFPMNSPGDDFGITFKGASIEEGYFTSNRKGGKGSDDIWYFSTPPIFFTLKGVVTDDSTKQIITGAIIKCVGSDGTVIFDTTDVTGGYFFSNKQILPNTSYDLLASKVGYYSAKGKESTVGFEQSRDLVHDFQLKPIPVPPVVLPDILYDLARWELKPQYHDSLNGLYQTLIDNPNIVIELGSHTDSRPIPMTNDTLSFKRAQSVIDYLITKGIEADRMKAKGYGQTAPRTLHRDMRVMYKNKSYSFNKGVTLTDDYINSLKTYEEKEAAHQLNRRTEFKVIAQNYVSKRTENDTTINRVIIKSGQNEDEEIEKDEEGSGSNDVTPNNTAVPNKTTAPVNNNKATNTNTNNKTPNKPK